MVKPENIWREQCDAAITIHARYGVQAALDYLIGEKLLHFTTAARKHPEFAEQLPFFVARLLQMFSRKVILRYIVDRETRLLEESDEVDPEEDIILTPGHTDDLESLRQILDFLRVERPGST
ncbi:hypothetical protein [Palleronia sp.]|uniref:hypothetical protein n=1 Tax=Palleronia sp. TaxID=1940284 RepID=UPI0035C8398F